MRISILQLIALLMIVCAFSLQAQSPQIVSTYTNDAVTGTTQAGLVSISSTNRVIATPSGSTDGVVGICHANCGIDQIGGFAQIAVSGVEPLNIDNATTAGDWIQIGSSGWQGHDTGSKTRPTSGQVIGIAASTNAGPGTSRVQLQLSGATGGFANPMTTAGQKITQGSSGPIATNEHINVEIYGCKPDGGTTDNRLCIFTALTYAASHPGLTLDFPCGIAGTVYAVKTPLGIRVPSNTTIQGDSKNACNIEWAATSDQGAVPALFDLTGSQYVAFRDIYIQGNSSFPTQTLVTMMRDSTNTGAGAHLFSHVIIAGVATKALIYNISSETNLFNSVHVVSNTANTYPLYISTADDLSVCQSNCQSGSFSMDSLVVDGMSAFYAGAGGDVIFDHVGSGLGDHVFRDSYLNTTSGAALAIKAGESGIVGSKILLEGNRVEGASYLVHFIANSGASGTVDYPDIQSNTFANATGTNCIYGDTGVTINHGQFIGNQCYTGGNVSSVDILTNSKYMVLSETVTARTTATGNILESPGTASAFILPAGASGNVLIQNGVISGIVSVQALSTDLICAAGNDVAVNAKAVTGATLVTSAVISMASSAGFLPGSKVTLSGITQAGWNGNYTATSVSLVSNTVTINLNSSALSAISGGTPVISLTCSNSSDAVSATPGTFSSSVTINENLFTTGKQFQFDLGFAAWSPANVTGTNMFMRLKAGGVSIYTNNGQVPLTASRPGFQFGGLFTITGGAANLAGAIPIIDSNSGPFFPGFSNDNLQNSTSMGNAIANAGSTLFTFTIQWVATGAGGTITYSSGGTATGTGNCLATASGGTGAGAAGLIGVSSGTISGNLTIGPSGSTTAAQTSTGSGYGAIPTSWTLTLPTTGGASTCSGTITTTGGTLVGAAGVALQINSLRSGFVN